MNSDIAFWIFTVVLTIVVFTPFFLAVNNKRLPRWFCDHAGWHLEPLQKGFELGIVNGICPRCGRHIMQDSHGNWF